MKLVLLAFLFFGPLSAFACPQFDGTFKSEQELGIFESTYAQSGCEKIVLKDVWKNSEGNTISKGKYTYLLNAGPVYVQTWNRNGRLYKGYRDARFEGNSLFKTIFYVSPENTKWTYAETVQVLLDEDTISTKMTMFKEDGSVDQKDEWISYRK